MERVGKVSMPYGYLVMLCLKDMMASIEVYRSKEQKQVSLRKKAVKEILLFSE